MANLNRHALKRRHKLEMQKRYMRKYGGPHSLKMFEDEQRRKEEEYADTYWGRKHPGRNGGWEYWTEWFMSGRRQYAKKYSDKRIRQKYRQMIKKMDPEDVTAPRGADYEKEYDYAWTVW